MSTETKEAERMGMHAIAAAAARSAAVANGLARGVFIGCSRPSVHSTRLAISAGRRPGQRLLASRSAASASGAGMVSSSISQIRSAPPARASASP